jgi:hypothetical protein
MTMFLPLPLSATSGRTETFLQVGYIVLTGNGCVSTLTSPEKPTDPHLWPIISVDEKHYNHWWHGKKNYATYNKHVSLIHS